MKTFIFRIIAVFSVLLAAQNAFAWGARAGLPSTFFSSDASATNTEISTISQTAANMAALAACEVLKADTLIIPNTTAGNCRLLMPFVNQCSAAVASDDTFPNLVAATEAEARMQLCTQEGFDNIACPNRVSVACDTTTCPAGQFVGADTCELCAAGSVAPAGTADSCTVCISPMVPNSANSMCENPTPTTCGVNEMQAPNGIGCVCATGFTGNPGACVQTPTTCGVNEMQAPNGIDCVCATGFTGNPGACVQTPTTCGVNEMQAPNGIGCVCATGFTGNPGACVQIPPPAPPAANNDSDEKRTEAVIGIMGIALFGILYNGGLTGGGEFGLTPDYTFAHNSGVMIHSYGGRLDYAADNFSAYYAAKKTAASGFVYSAGMEYAKDFYNLAYNAKSEGDNTAANIAAGLKWQSGILQYQSGITAEYELTKIADDFSAYWNNAAELKYQGWKITPSANIYFRQGEEFGDNINLRLNLRREF